MRELWREVQEPVGDDGGTVPRLESSVEAELWQLERILVLLPWSSWTATSR